MMLRFVSFAAAVTVAAVLGADTAAAAAAVSAQAGSSLSSSSSASSSCWRNTTCSGPTGAAFPGPWDSNIYAPSSRLVSPKAIIDLATGEQIGNYTASSPIELRGNGSALVLDFGIEVGGIVHLQYSSTDAGALGLAFSEAKDWIGEWSDGSNGAFKGPDRAVYARFTGKTQDAAYAVPDAQLRGGFRYLTLFLVTNTTDTSISISDINTEIGFQPTWPDLRAYQGYFHSSDELLNRIWYAGAYTLQTNAVPPDTGRAVPFLSEGWANNGTLGPGDTILVDGAKRDRAVWPGDMGVALPGVAVSTGDLDSARNALQVMFDYQNASTGAFPEAGPPLLQKGSDTYHMWTMIGTYNYVLYSDDVAFLSRNWEGYLKAMEFVYAKVGESGLLNVTGTRDWARLVQGGNNSEANMILYHTLTTGATLADWLSESDSNTTTNLTSLSALFTHRATTLHTAINKHLFSPAHALYADNATHPNLYPQDANALALLYNLPPRNSSTALSQALTANWTPLGPAAPELPHTISPFISSLELLAHFSAHYPARALRLLRTTWGWYLDHPNGTQSTLAEGWRDDGSWAYRKDRGYANDASYVSHAHGWSAGPTAALSQFVVGLRVTERGGRAWVVEPLGWGELESAEGGFVTPRGRFWARWEEEDGGARVLEWSVPSGSQGVAVVPARVVGRGLEDLSVLLEGRDAMGLAVHEGGVSVEVGWDGLVRVRVERAAEGVYRVVVGRGGGE
ncbi:glycoside hydrolase family 78 protein [Aplosporella prunicola CBS 121167]|uniref:Glycoside hydrolase family 78 protein n=1 Tax=Aplosporella prunicola CBS 121167 TaxID=1176127 RepID=A0A6A6BQJ6_9PEZI|nr:glycoside hydrolase family 78 protein [Aplosporella prunicola CBS 121167]KAF2146366.1 glycoside hydrolase family 78 protein [Aplosporella prunicola CBS 121167]